MLKQRFVVQFVSQFGVKISGMIAGLVVARVAGPEVVGIIAYGTAYISIWGFITGLFGTGHIKLISEEKNFENCLTTYSWLQAGSLMVFTGCILGLFFFQKYFLQDFFESRTHEIVIFLILASFILDQTLDFGNVTFTAKLEQFKANFPLMVKAAIYNLGRILVVLLGFKAIGLAATNVVSGILALPLAWRFVRKLRFGSFDRDLFKQHLSYALPIFLIVVINSIMEYSDKLLLAHYSDTREVGYYTAAYSIGGMFLMFSHSSSIVFFPLFSNLIAEKNWDSVNQKIERFQSFIVLFIFPIISLMIIIGAPFLITLIGEKYQPSVLPFKILLFATYLSMVGMPYGNILSGMGLFYQEALIKLICLVVFICSVFFLTNPAFLGLGAVGIALTLVILNLVRNSLYLLFSSFRAGDVKLNPSLIFPYLLIAAVSFVVIFFEPSLSAWNYWWWLIVSPAYMIVIYFLLYRLGLLRQKDIEQFLDVINVKKLRRYLGSELNDNK